VDDEAQNYRRLISQQSSLYTRVRALQQCPEEAEVLSETIRQFFGAMVKEKILLEEALVLVCLPKVASFDSGCLFSGSYRIFSVQF
jgi:hypothetical protein